METWLRMLPYFAFGCLFDILHCVLWMLQRQWFPAHHACRETEKDFKLWLNTDTPWCCPTRPLSSGEYSASASVRWSLCLLCQALVLFLCVPFRCAIPLPSVLCLCNDSAFSTIQWAATGWMSTLEIFWYSCSILDCKQAGVLWLLLIYFISCCWWLWFVVAVNVFHFLSLMTVLWLLLIYFIFCHWWLCFVVVVNVFHFLSLMTMFCGCR